MPSSRKKVIVRKFSRDWLAGYLPPSGFVHDERLEMLDLAGKVIELELADVKWVCFVRDFNSGEPNNPERLVRRTFAGRPRSEGVWLRMRLKDTESIEGLAANDVSLLDADGIFLTPPDTRSNTQRIFLPRASVTELEVVAVVGSAVKRKPGPAAASVEQETLFPT